MSLIDQYKEEIIQTCSDHQVEKLFIFGSVKTENFNDQSDIDFLIQFSALVPPPEYFNNYMDFKEKLESLLGRKIDLVEIQAVRNPVFRMILDRDKVLIYERKSA